MAEQVVTSFYGVDPVKEKLNPEFADGTKFDPNAMAAASWFYPLGTKLRVVDPVTQQSVVVIVKDRGPAKSLLKTRQLDLTVGAWDMLGLNRDQGLANVIIEPMGD